MSKQYYLAQTTDQTIPEPPTASSFPIAVEYGILGICLALMFRAVIGPGLTRLRKYIDEPEYDAHKIYNSLYQLLTVSKADRTAICMFHNGEKFSSGAKFMKLTMTHEAVNPGVSRISRDFKALPTSHFTELLGVKL